MNIAVLGAGKVGGTLANLWAERGHTIYVGARDPNSEKRARLRRKRTMACR